MILASAIGLSCAKMGYDVSMSVGGTTWYINRFSENMSFNNYENVTGAGNFSRYSRMNGISDIGFTEKSSAIRGGDLSLDQRTRFLSREGPVVVSYKLNSLATPTATGKSKLVESGKVRIDEVWPFYFLNYKNIHYAGRGIRNSEIYDNNGEIISTSSDSYRLQKESAYATYGNRTQIYTEISPSGVIEDRSSNKSSMYVLALKAVGSLTSLDVTKGRPTDEWVTRRSNEDVVQVSQDYRGIVDMNLKIASSETVPLKKYYNTSCWGGTCEVYGDPCEDFSDYLPCCMAGYSGLTSYDRQHLSADCVFNCYSCGEGYPESPARSGRIAIIDTAPSPKVKQPAVLLETKAASNVEPKATLEQSRETEAMARLAKELSESGGNDGEATPSKLSKPNALDEKIERPRYQTPDEDQLYAEIRSD